MVGYPHKCGSLIVCCKNTASKRYIARQVEWCFDKVSLDALSVLIVVDAEDWTVIVVFGGTLKNPYARSREERQQMRPRFHRPARGLPPSVQIDALVEGHRETQIVGVAMVGLFQL